MLKIPTKSILSPFMATAWNILVLFLAYTLTRIEYLLENFSYFSQNIDDGSIWHLLWGGMVFDTPGIFYTNALYILLMLLPCHYKERAEWYKICKWIFLIVNSLFLLLNIADSVYFSYTMKRTTWSIFSEFGRESFAKIILTETVRHWYLIFFFVGIIWLLWRLYISPALNLRNRKLWIYYMVSVLALAAAAIITAGGIRGGLVNHWYLYIITFPVMYAGWLLYRYQPGKISVKIASGTLIGTGILMVAIAPIGGWRHRDIRPIALSNASAYTSRPIETALVLNTSFSMIRSIGDVAFRNPHYFDNKTELDNIYSPLHIPNDSILKKSPRKKNLIIIIIESYGREYIGGMNKEILGNDYKGYTPFTDSLLQHSAWWKYSYDNSQKSIDGMPSVLASIPKFTRSFISTPQAMNDLQGLPGLLKTEGYSSAFFHGARTGSMGFDAFARSIGFMNYYGREDFNKDSRFNGDKDFDGYWAIWDEPFLQYFALKMSEMKQPFVAALFTASNHHPFRIPPGYEGRFLQGTMKIHPTAGYTDNALREFFNTAKKQLWYYNSVFVMTNDHTNMRGYDEYRSDIGAFYGPIIFFDPSGEIIPGERNSIAQQIDIMPTLLNMVGFPRPYVAFGNDLFSVPDRERWAVNNINGTYQYIRNGYILQFDGVKATGLFLIDDHKLTTNLINKAALGDTVAKMEKEVKALIQSYMDRMLENRLTADVNQTLR